MVPEKKLDPNFLFFRRKKFEYNLKTHNQPINFFDIVRSLRKEKEREGEGGGRKRVGKGTETRFLV